MTVHDLKCWPRYFGDVQRGDKNFEVRKNDRDFRVGDTLLLYEWDPTTGFATGAVATRTVGYICDLTPVGCPGFVAMGLKP